MDRIYKWRNCNTDRPLSLRAALFSFSVIKELKQWRRRRWQKRLLKNVNSRSFKIHRSSSMALNLSNVSEFFWSWILKGFRALSICQNWPARPFPSQRKFLFYPKHYTRKRWFSEKNSWEKPISFAKWLVRQWSNQPVLTNGKRPKFKKRIRK